MNKVLGWEAVPTCSRKDAPLREYAAPCRPDEGTQAQGAQPLLRERKGKENRKGADARFRANHREERNEYNRKYYQEHKEYFAEYQKKYRAMKAA